MWSVKIPDKVVEAEVGHLRHTWHSRSSSNDTIPEARCGVGLNLFIAAEACITLQAKRPWAVQTDPMKGKTQILWAGFMFDSRIDLVVMEADPDARLRGTYSPQWNPMVENQAIARALQLGQKRDSRLFDTL